MNLSANPTSLPILLQVKRKSASGAVKINRVSCRGFAVNDPLWHRVCSDFSVVLMSGKLFQGQYYDEETGLHYNRHRYYDPNTGSFLTEDPIKLAGGINNYRYTPNPISWIDPLGLMVDNKNKEDHTGGGLEQALDELGNIDVDDPLVSYENSVNDDLLRHDESIEVAAAPLAWPVIAGIGRLLAGGARASGGRAGAGRVVGSRSTTSTSTPVPAVPPIILNNDNTESESSDIENDTATDASDAEENDQCQELYARINSRVNLLKKRYWELLEDKLDLYNTRPTGSMSWEGHRQQFQGVQRGLRRLLEEADTKGCVNYHPEAWHWASVDTPSRPL